MAKKASTSRYGIKGEKLKVGESYNKALGLYVYRWTDKFGERHQISRKKLTDLREQEKKIERNLADGIRMGEQNITLNDVFEVWVKDKVGLKDNTKSNYVYMYRHFVQNTFGTLRIQEIRKSDVRRFYNTIIGEGRNKVLVSTLESIHTVLHQVFNLAVEDNYIRMNPSDGVLGECKRANNIEVPKRHALTIPEQTAFINYVKHTNKYKHWSPLFTFMLGTGCRIGEVAGLRWEDVHMETDNGWIDINHNLVYFKADGRKCITQISSPKTAAGRRVIPLLPEVRQALFDEKSYQKEVGLTCSCTIDGYTDFIFLNRDGKNLNQQTVNRAIKRILRDYNTQELDEAEKEGRIAVLLPNFSCHNLRHTFATRYCENETNLKLIQKILGHKDISTTMDVYVDATRDKLNESFENLAGKIVIS